MEHRMEVENLEDYAIQVVIQPHEDIHPLALVATNVNDQNVNISDDSNLVQENAQYAEESSNDAAGRYSTAISVTSTRVQTPVNFDEESNQSEDVESANPPSKKRTFSDDERDEEGSLCPICFDDWTNTGEHRICALKCGHLFGHKCIIYWLNSQKKKTCPTCKNRVGKNDDIRFIYAKKLTAVDTTELENIRKQLDAVTEERNKFQTELATYAYRELLLNQQIMHLKSQLGSFTRGQIQTSTINRPVEQIKLYMEKAMEICKSGGSRVFDARCELDLLMASMKSPTNLFAGFGLKKISISDYRTIAFIPAHSLQIRDICFHKENNWVLTASMDKTFKVINNHENSVMYQFSHQMPLWSCCWDNNNSFGLFVGTQSGAVIKYDIRQLAEPVATYSIEGDMSPVVSVASIPASPGDVLPHGGIVSCKLNSLWVYENINTDIQIRHPISLEGPFVSMKYQENTKQLLVSSRPNSRIAFARHTLCNFGKKEDNKIDCNIIHTFQGGGMQKLLSKSCFLSYNNNDYVAAHQENCKSVLLWSINTGDKVASITAHDSVYDLKGLQNQNGSFLVSLTDKKLEFFKFA